MMRVVQRVELNASAEDVFRAISEHEELSEWLLPSARVTLAQRGALEKNGVGAVREIANGRFVGREEIVEYEAPKHLHYRVVRGLPLRHHLGRVEIQSKGPDQVEVVWEVEFETSIWGLNRPLRWMINRTIKQGLARLPEHLIGKNANRQEKPL